MTTSNYPLFIGTSKESDKEQITCDLYHQWSIQNHCQKPSWGFLFCGDKLRADLIFDRIRSQFDNVFLFGGSCSGISFNDTEQGTGFETALVLYSANIPRPECYFTSLLRNSKGTSQNTLVDLAVSLKKESHKLLLFSLLDSFELNSMSSILSRLSSGTSRLQNNNISGSILTTRGHLRYCFLFCGNTVTQNSLVCLEFPTSVNTQFFVSRHSTVISSFLKVTAIDGTKILRLDDIPVLDVLNSHANNTNRFNNAIFMGVKQGELFAPDDKAVFKVLLGEIDEEQACICCSEAAIRKGDLIQFMNLESIDTQSAIPTKSTSQRAEVLKQHNQHLQLLSKYLNVPPNEGKPSKIQNPVLSRNVEKLPPKIYSEQEILLVDGKLIMSCGYQISVKIDSSLNAPEIFKKEE